MSQAAMVAGWYADHTGDLAWWEQHHWSSEIEWRAIEGAPDDVGPIKGVAQLSRYYMEWAELFDDLRIDVNSAHDVGELVVLSLHVSGRSRSTGMPLSLDHGVVIELDGELILRGREYATLKEALDAAEATAAADQTGRRAG